MLRRLLVPLDPSPYSEAATDFACDLAAGPDAEVTGLVVVDTPGIHDSVSPISPGAAHYAEKAELRLEAEAHQRLGELLERFSSKCDAAKVAHRSFERQGDPVDIIGNESAYYDLLVMGLRTHFHFQTSNEPGKTLSQLLGKLATPILAVPEKYTPIGATLTTVIAFDGSPASIRSMRQFAQTVAPRNLDIVILTSSDELADAREIYAPVEEYLAAYGFDNIRAEWTPMDIRDAIDDSYLTEAEVIVAGMHAKHGLFSFHVGSLTDHLISKAQTPVFIGQ